MLVEALQFAMCDKVLKHESYRFSGQLINNVRETKNNPNISGCKKCAKSKNSY